MHLRGGSSTILGVPPRAAAEKELKPARDKGAAQPHPRGGAVGAARGSEGVAGEAGAGVGDGEVQGGVGYGGAKGQHDARADQEPVAGSERGGGCGGGDCGSRKARRMVNKHSSMKTRKRKELEYKSGTWDTLNPM